MIAVIFALPQESRDFIRARGKQAAAGGPDEVSVGHCGVGPQSAATQIAAILAGPRPELLISAGFAGALDPQLQVADILVATNFSEGTLVERTRQTLAQNSLPARFGTLTSRDGAIESVAGKAALAAHSGAMAVDMETETIAAACARASIPMLAIRVISDASTDPLPVPMNCWFDLTRQKPRPLALMAYLAAHPSKIGPFTRFVRGLTPARQALTRVLLAVTGKI